MSGKRLSEFEKGQILAFNSEGKSYRWIAREIGRDCHIISKFVQDPNNYGIKKRGGSKSKLSNRDQRRILQTASNSQISCSRLKNELELDVHPNTILHSNSNKIMQAYTNHFLRCHSSNLKGFPC